MERTIDIRFNALMKELKRSDFSFQLILAYVFIEYVRPQTMYPSINFIPYGKVIITLCILSSFFKKYKPVLTRTANTEMLSFMIVIVISSCLGVSFQTSFAAWPDYFDWLVIYYIIIRTVCDESRFTIFTILFTLCSFKMAQHSVRGWIAGGMGYSSYGFGAGTGFFHNSGEFGVQMCIYFPIAYYSYISLRKQLSALTSILMLVFPITGFLGFFSSSSRGTLLGGCAVLIWIAITSKNKIRTAIVILIIIVISTQIIPTKQIERLKESGDDNTSLARIETWKNGLTIANKYPVFGAGYKTWMVIDKKYYHGSGLVQHNIFIECLSELGYVGLFAFVWLIWTTFKINSITRKMLGSKTRTLFFYNMSHAFDAALVGYLVSGFFVTVLYYPFFWINLAMSVALNNVSYRITHATG